MSVPDAIEVIRKALKHLPAKHLAARNAALAALEEVDASQNALRVRFLQANVMPPLDERGNPVSQTVVDTLIAQQSMMPRKNKLQLALERGDLVTRPLDEIARDQKDTIQWVKKMAKHFPAK